MCKLIPSTQAILNKRDLLTLCKKRDDYCFSIDSINIINLYTYTPRHKFWRVKRLIGTQKSPMYNKVLYITGANKR